MKYTDEYFQQFAKLPAEKIESADLDFLCRIMMTNDPEHIDGLYNHFLKEAWVLEAIQKRIEAFNLDIDKSAQLLILYCCEGIIGHAVTYIHYLEYCMKQIPKKITGKIFFEKIFATGWPSIESINELNKSFK